MYDTYQLFGINLPLYFLKYNTKITLNLIFLYSLGDFKGQNKSEKLE